MDCLEREAQTWQDAKPKTIYIGGGTPSLLNADHLRRLLRIVRSVFDCSAVDEWTIEANPEDIDEAKARLFEREGLSRVSLGLQTFDTRLLNKMGRCHTADRGRRAFACLRRAGCKHINVDMMFALPGQALAQLRRDLKIITSLDPEHISYYAFTVEQESRFEVEDVSPLPEDQQARQYIEIGSALEKRGFRQYEVSNFAKDGEASRHNIHYWKGGNYIGLGVGAHSHLDGIRKWNGKRLRQYIVDVEAGRDPTEDSESLSPARRLHEALVYGLRMNAGVDLKGLERHFGLALEPEAVENINDFCRSGLLFQDGVCLRATPRGRLVLDEIAVRLI